MRQSRFIGPITLTLLGGLWGAAWLTGAPSQTVGGLAALTLIATVMAWLTLR